MQDISGRGEEIEKLCELMVAAGAEFIKGKEEYEPQEVKKVMLKAVPSDAKIDNGMIETSYSRIKQIREAE